MTDSTVPRSILVVAHARRDDTVAAARRVIAALIAWAVVATDWPTVAKQFANPEVAMKLLRTLSIVSRRRWPDWAETAVKIGTPPPKKKADAPAAADAAAGGDAPKE